jgi:hypothetical protein
MKSLSYFYEAILSTAAYDCTCNSGHTAD